MNTTMARHNEFADLAQLVLERDAREEYTDRVRELPSSEYERLITLETESDLEHDFFNRPDIGES